MNNDKINDFFLSTLNYYNSFPENERIKDSEIEKIKKWFEAGFYAGLTAAITESEK